MYPIREDGNPGLKLGRIVFRCALGPAALAVLIAVPCPAKSIEASGTASAWASTHVSGPALPILGFRYLPTFAFEKALPKGKSRALRFEGGLNAFGTASFPARGGAITDGKVRLYRAWGRYTTARFEARIGLQRIDFGSASILRPLMWFDTIDPRDPLQITDGVSGLLVKYTFQSNANVWAWGLYGNGRVRGWDTSPTAQHRPEFGGRVQLPVPKGEVALTYHHRTVGGSAGFPGMPRTYPEDRVGFDGKWDLGVGLWFEGALIKASDSRLPFPYRRAMTVGADYTFGLGNGLHVLGEHFDLRDTASVLGRGPGVKVSALSLSYPASIVDALSAILYHDWGNHRLYRFLSWKRTYDRWSFLLIAFWNPAAFDIYRSTAAGATFGGKGLQLMVIFNY